MRLPGWFPALHVSLAAVGLTSTIGQLVLMRELTAVFYGNELVLGLILAAWLVWVAVGAWGLEYLSPLGSPSKAGPPQYEASGVGRMATGLAIAAALWNQLQGSSTAFTHRSSLSRSSRSWLLEGCSRSACRGKRITLGRRSSGLGRAYTVLWLPSSPRSSFCPEIVFSCWLRTCRWRPIRRPSAHGWPSEGSRRDG